MARAAVTVNLGLTEGDPAASVNGRKTADAKTFLETAKKTSPREGLLLGANRRGRRIFLSYREVE